MGYHLTLTRSPLKQVDKPYCYTTSGDPIHAESLRTRHGGERQTHMEGNLGPRAKERYWARSRGLRQNLKLIPGLGARNYALATGSSLHTGRRSRVAGEQTLGKLLDLGAHFSRQSLAGWPRLMECYPDGPH